MTTTQPTTQPTRPIPHTHPPKWEAISYSAWDISHDGVLIVCPQCQQPVFCSRDQREVACSCGEIYTYNVTVAVLRKVQPGERS